MDARNLRGSKRGLPSETAGSPGRKGTPSSGARPRTTALGVVTALALPAARAETAQPASPLPLGGLHQLPRDASMLYDIRRVDRSGRVVSGDIIDALRWRPGSTLDVIVTRRTIVIRTAPGGRLRVPPRPCIIIPSHARRPHGISPGDHVLIAAAPEFSLVIVYPLSALDEMISRYHAAHREDEGPQ
jgi:bifunctional DNA-binding transcriptional regulator/antitoxin component of YhaV-PrlF toxin-antitoxin module